MNLYKWTWYSQLMSYLVYLVVCSVLCHASSDPPGFASKPSRCRSMFHAGSLFHQWSEVRSWVGSPTVLVGPFMMAWWLSVSVSVSWTLAISSNSINVWAPNQTSNNSKLPNCRPLVISLPYWQWDLGFLAAQAKAALNADPTSCSLKPSTGWTSVYIYIYMHIPIPVLAESK